MRKRIKVNNDNNYFGFCELSGKACFKKECCNNKEVTEEDIREINSLLAFKENIKYLIDNM